MNRIYRKSISMNMSAASNAQARFFFAGQFFYAFFYFYFFGKNSCESLRSVAV